MSSTYEVENINSITNISDLTDPTKKVNFDLSNISADTTRTITIPNLNITLTGTTTTQTLTNKTISALQNTITNISNANVSSSAGIDATKIADGTVNNTKFQYINSLSSQAVGISDSQTLTNKNLTDSFIYFQNNGDNTKKFQFDLSDITSGLTRNVTIPDGNLTLVGTTLSQTLTNKTIDAIQNTLTNVANSNIKSNAAIDATKIANGSVSNTAYQYLSGATSNIQTQINNHASTSVTHGVSGSVVGTSDSQVLSNKTMTDTSTSFQNNGDNTKKFKFSASTIGTGTTRTITIPNSDLTLAGLSVAQTLTNKTIDANNNTMTNISDSSIKAAAAIDASKIADGTVSNTEYQHLNGLTGNIQTQMNTHTSDTGNPHGVTKAQVSLGNVQNTKVNLSATTNPSAADDSSAGYTIGSKWINTTNEKEYVCVDNTTSSASWKETTLSNAYDAIVDINGTGDYTSIYEAFNVGHKTVFVKKGTYTETNNIIIPDNGVLVGESISDTVINLSGSVSVKCDGSAGTKETVGTISFTTDSTTVTGSATLFTNLSPGDYILIGQNFIEIDSITNDTTLILKDNYRGQSQSNQPYVGQSMKTGIIIKNLTITNSSSSGLFIRAIRHSIIESIVVQSCIANIEIYDSASNGISNIVSYDSASYGLKIDNCYSASLYACEVYNSDNHGVLFSGASENFIINGMSSNNNDGNGINFIDTCKSIDINDGLFINNDGLGINTEPTTCSIIINNSTLNGNGDSGIDFDGCDNIVSNCVIKNNGVYGVQAGDAGIITNNLISNNANNGINMDSDEKCVVSGNRITNNAGNGIWSNDDWIVITNNYIEGNTNDGIVLSGGNDCLIGNNIINNNGTYGIHLSGASNRAIVTGNKVISHTIGVHIAGTSHDCSVGGNMVTLASSHGIKILTNTNTIYGNRCRDNSGSGLYVDTGATNNSIMINDFTGNTGSDITDNGTVNSSLPPIFINDIDARSATTLLIGRSKATKIELADTGIITEVKGNLDVLEGLDVTGNITTTGTVDGRDIANDGSSLDSHLAASSGIHGITGTIVGTSDSQTLTNKTIDADSNTISNIDNADIKALAAIDATKIADGSVSNTEFQYINSLTSNVQTQINDHLADTSTHGVSGVIIGTTDTQTLTNKTWGDSLNMNGNKIINLATPTINTDVATKAYVDSAVTGLNFKDSTMSASTVDLDSNSSISGSITYNSTAGSSGRGQITGTLVTTNIFTIDGVNFGSSDDGSRILLKNQASGDQNGIWTTTISGTSLTLDRATDFDQDGEVIHGTFIFVEYGTTNVNSGYVLSTNNPIVIGGASGTSLNFTQFSGNGQILAGSGLTKTGDTINAIGSNTIIANADNLEVNSSGTSNQILLSSGTVGQTATFGALPLNNTNAVSGTLPINRGGTNATSYTAGSRIIATNSGNTALEATSLDPSTIVTLAGSNTLTNKTIDADSNTIANIDNTNVKLGAAIDATKIADGTVSNTEFQYINSLTSNVQTQLDAKVTLSTNQTISGQKTFTGHNAFGATATIDSNIVLRIDEEITAGGTLEGLYIRAKSKPSSAGIYNIKGLAGYTTIENTDYNAGSTVDGLTYGVYGIGTSGHSANVDISGITTGIYMNNGASLSVNKAYGANIFLGRDLSGTSGSLSVTNAYVMKLDDGDDGLTATNHYGLYIEEPSRGTTNYTIYTTGGDHRFGGNLDVTGNITLSGTVDGRDINTDGTNLDAHIAATNAHGVSGSVVGTVNTQTLSNKTIDTAVNTLVIAATDITSGTLDDLRVSASNVTQHEGSINHDNLLDFVANEHIDHSTVSINAGTGLSGGGTIAATRTIDVDVNGLTIDASPDGAADYVMTYDASAATHKKVLVNDLIIGGGGGSLTTYEVTATTDTSTQDSSYTQLDSMTITPSSGTYIISFSASGNNTSGNANSIYAIYSAGSKVAHSERQLAWGGGGHTGDFDAAMHTQAEVTVNGSQVIEIKYAAVTGSFSVHERSMHLIKK